MTAFAISRAHGLLISILISVLPVNSFLPPTWAMAERRWSDGIFGGLGLQPQDALTIARETGFRYAEATAQAKLGKVYLAHGEWGEAVRHFEQALEIADDIANTEFQKDARG